MAIPLLKAYLHLEIHQYNKNQVFYKFKNQIFLLFIYYYFSNLVNNQVLIQFEDQIETYEVINPKRQRRNLEILKIQYFLKNFRLNHRYLNLRLLVKYEVCINFQLLFLISYFSKKYFDLELLNQQLRIFIYISLKK